MPKRIVITSLGSFGDVYPYIGLALGLQARGHDAVLAMPAYYRDAVQREGLAFHPVRPDIDPTDRETIARIMDAASGTEFLLSRVVGALQDSFRDLTAAARGADLLVTHPITFAGPIVAEREQLPWVSTVLAPMSFFSADDMPVFPPAPWTKRLEHVPGASAALVGIAKYVTRRWVEPVQALRQTLGLPRAAHPLFEGQHAPRLVLALFSPLLAEPQPDWPPNVQITGAIPYNGPASGAPLDASLDDFLRAGPPPFVFTLGTSAVGAAGRFYQESVEAVRRLGVRGVLLAGSHAENRPPGPLPDEVRIEAFAPHATLFPRASLVVHQGGAGTLHQALRSGRPQLIVPFAHDQPDNAYRTERLGVSRTLHVRRYRAAHVATTLDALLGDETIRTRALEVAEAVRAEDAVNRACDALLAACGA